MDPGEGLAARLAHDAARAALSLAARFDGGATMWCVSPTWPHHARHVAVEFVHPVVVGKPALPAVAVPAGPPLARLEATVRRGDVVVVIGPAGPELEDAARQARSWGATTVWIGNGARPASVADHLLWVDDDHAAVRGRFVLLYHLLWELTQIALEVPGPSGRAGTSGPGRTDTGPTPPDPEPTGFLYPMLDHAGSDRATLLDDLAASAGEKLVAHDRVVAAAIDRWSGFVEGVAAAVVESARRGGMVLTMGNGGSATDADGVAATFADPLTGTPVPARSLVADVAVVTALSNDIGYEHVFARQVIAYGRPQDVLVGFSTSGNSPNLLRAFGEARRRGLTTVGFAGDRGGAMAGSEDIDHLAVVDAPSIHRIQEAHAALAHAVWSEVQAQIPVQRDDLARPRA